MFYEEQKAGYCFVITRRGYFKYQDIFSITFLTYTLYGILPISSHSIPEFSHFIPEKNHSLPEFSHFIPEENHFIPEYCYPLAEENHFIPEENHSLPEFSHFTSKENHFIPEDYYPIPEENDKRSLAFQEVRHFRNLLMLQLSMQLIIFQIVLNQACIICI